jgi:flagellar protein FliS
MQQGYGHYQRTQAETSDSGELLLMLFDGAIRFTQKAIYSLSEGDVPGKCEAISRAFAIVAELHGTLDFEVSEEVAGNLASLYLFVLENYISANVQSEVRPLVDILTVLNTLREGWAGAVQQVRKQHAQVRTEGGCSPPPASLSFVAG